MSGMSFDYWAFFLAQTRRHNAPLYEAFTRAFAQHQELRELAHMVRPGQPPANMLYAAVHYVLLRGNDHELRRFYPNLNRGRTSRDLELVFAAFQDFVAINRDEIVCGALAGDKHKRGGTICRSARGISGVGARTARTGAPNRIGTKCRAQHDLGSVPHRISLERKGRRLRSGRCPVRHRNRTARRTPAALGPCTTHLLAPRVGTQPRGPVAP